MVIAISIRGIQAKKVVIEERKGRLDPLGLLMQRSRLSLQGASLSQSDHWMAQRIWSVPTAEEQQPTTRETSPNTAILSMPGDFDNTDRVLMRYAAFGGFRWSTIELVRSTTRTKGEKRILVRCLSGFSADRHCLSWAPAIATPDS